MKFTEILRGYVVPEAGRIAQIWSEAHFCLDTNVLLDVYRYTEKTREDFFRLLEALKDRLFVPHRIAVEFARNRVPVIKAHFEPQRHIAAKLDQAAEEIHKRYRKNPLCDEFVTLIGEAKSLFDEKYRDAENRHMALLTADTLLKRLLAVVGDDVGEPYPKAEVEKEYKRRKEDTIPPFCKMDDDKDEERRVGDVVIWLELMKRFDGTKTALIFVLDDLKANWWQEVGGKHEPQPTLVQEAFARVGADILFYTAERFSKTAAARLGVTISAALETESRQIREQERELGRRRLQRMALSADDNVHPAKPRLSTLAFELGMSASKLLSICHQAGLPVQNQLTVITPELQDAILELVEAVGSMSGHPRNPETSSEP